MTSTVSPTNLFQISIQHDRHKLRLNTIKSQSSPVLNRERKQMSLMSSRNAHQQYNFKWKNAQNSNEINKKNNKILDKLNGLSRVRHPSTQQTDRLRNSMILNRSASKNQMGRSIQTENQRFVRKLFHVKSTLSQTQMRTSYHEHKNRSQMLSRYKFNERGMNVPKSESVIQKRIKLEPVHQKLKLVESKVRIVKQVKIDPSPLKFNSMKLMRMNPERY